MLCSVCYLLRRSLQNQAYRPRYIPHTLTELQETRAASQDVIEFSAEMKQGQLTYQLKQAVSKPGHVNNSCYWFVNLKVSCYYKTALIGWYPIKIVCKAICIGLTKFPITMCVWYSSGTPLAWCYSFKSLCICFLHKVVHEKLQSNVWNWLYTMLGTQRNWVPYFIGRYTYILTIFVLSVRHMVTESDVRLIIIKYCIWHLILKH